MQQVNGVPVYSSDPSLLYTGLDEEPTWFSAQGGVYKCIEVSSHKQVAIKKYLVEENSPHQDMFVMPKELVENEIYSMTKCIDANILKLLAVHLHEEFVYLIMPLCTGGSLQQYVFEHHLTVGQLVHIITSIASGLAKVHGNGYIHRDIKCDNIFLDQENNNIVIGDFGVVSISPAADSSIEEAGVVLFWSPELVQQKIINHKVDIWALGIVILEVLNGGKAPYEDEKLDEEEIKQRILDMGKPDYPPNLPSRLVDLLDCCLDPDPRSRSSANTILQHPFLKDYEPELLFPATRLEEEESITSSLSSQSDLEEMHDLEQQQQQPIHKETILLPLPTTSSRLPLPSFSVDKSISSALTVNEKIANVIRKRQSMTDSGSRIPMLCILQPIIEEQQQPIRTVKSVRLHALSPEQQKSLSGSSANSNIKKPLLRSNTMPSLHQQHQINKSPIETTATKKRASSRSPLTDIKTNYNIRKSPQQQPPPTQKAKKELPPKCSIYRHKRLPAGESRTARLMMGVSTNGRRQSFRQREEPEKELAPTLGHGFGKLFHRPQPPLTSSSKTRPMSFVASPSLLNNKFNHHTEIPTIMKSIPSREHSTSPRSKRQSVPVVAPSTKEEGKKSGSIKAPLRVY